jgi:hypothetical protein
MPVTERIARPIFDGSAWLTAVMVTGSIVGGAAGARQSTLPELGPVGEMQGLEPGWQICPTVGFPFGIPFTSQDTAVSDVLVSVAAKNARWRV